MFVTLLKKNMNYNIHNIQIITYGKIWDIMESLGPFTAHTPP